jgi:hypothetical protein
LGDQKKGMVEDLHFWDAVMEGQNLRKGFIPCPGESVFSSREKKCSYFVLPQGANSPLAGQSADTLSGLLQSPIGRFWV